MIILLYFEYIFINFQVPDLWDTMQFAITMVLKMLSCVFVLLAVYVLVLLYYSLFLTITQSNSLVSPNSYTQTWNDRGSGGDLDGSFWAPNCPSGTLININKNYPSNLLIMLQDIEPLVTFQLMDMEHQVLAKYIV